MRKDQVDALLEHAKTALEEIEEQYNKALKETTIPPSLQIHIKNYMENLRSALDYIAHDIYEQEIAPHRISTGKQEIREVYFPYGNTETDFKSRVGSSLPELKNVSPSLYNTLEAIQPYKAGDTWLFDFCRILNEKKHDILSPQKREEKRGLIIDFGGPKIQMGPGSSISGTGFIGTGRGGIHLQGDTISGDSPAHRTSGKVKQTIIRWISFKFADTGVEVLPLLKKAMTRIRDFSNDVYQQL